jgi:PKD repeat protein
LRLGSVVALTCLCVVSQATPTSAQPADGWRISLQATKPSLTDKASLTVGATSTAALGVDPLDDPHPPTLPSRSLDLVTRHSQAELGWAAQSLPVMRYRAEYGPSLGSSARTLDFSLETDQMGPVTVTWTITSDLDLAAHFLTLRDVTTGASVDMWAASSYSLTATPGSRALSIEVSPGRVPPPVAFDQAVTLAEDTSLPITLGGADSQNRALTYRTLTPPSHGTLLGSEPSVTHFPAVNYNGPDAFTFVANNGSADSNLATVNITVTPVNDTPVAVGQSVSTDEDTPLTIHLRGTDVDGDALTFSVASGPSHGALSGTGADVVYTPVPDYNGADVFSVTVSDGQLSSVPAAVTIAVVAIPDPPRAAFSVPGPARDAATLDNNVASFFEGASSAGASGETAGFPASQAIDESAQTLWKSTNGQPTNQSLTVELPEGSSINRIRLVNGYSTGGQAVKRFEVRVSTTTTEPAAFTTVLSDVALDAATVQEFALAATTPARYVQLFALDNWGSPCCVAVRGFEALSDALGGIPTYSPLPSKPASVSSYLSPDFRPELILDGKPSTAWRSASGRVTNEFVEVRLDDEVLVDRVRILGWPSAADWPIKDFDVLVSATTDTAAAFAPVLSATNLNNGTLQEFAFPGGPRRARYVRLLAKNNYGNTVVLTVSSFEVVTVASEGNRISTNATVLGYSSQLGSFGAQAALDTDPAPPGWVTASGQTNNQWIKIALPASHAWLVDHVALQPRAEPGFEAFSPRRFEIEVSTTTSDDTAFATVLNGTLRNNGILQHFFFDSVDAKYVRVLLKDNYGGSASGLQTFAVYSPQIGSLSARFRDRSTDVDGAISAYAWLFGDGGSSSERDPAHAYPTAGHYDVSLAATDDTSLTGSRTQPYDAVGGPQPSFSVSPSAPGEGATLTFSDTSADPAGVVLREWDFGDGKPRIVAAGPIATHAYDDDGAYHVALRVTNSWGTPASVSQDLPVANLPPTTDAGPDRKVRLGLDWGALPIVGDPGPADVASLRCQWSFGDGQTADIQNCSVVTARVPHTYATQGIYTATLTVTDKNGAASTDSMTVRVYPPECVLGTTTFVEFPFCGNGYSVASLGSVPALQAQSYSGLVVDRNDSTKLLLGTNATNAQGAIYSVGLVRDTGHHVTGFSGTPALVASVPDIDGGLAYGPNGVLFTAQYPDQSLVQIKPGSHAPDKVTPESLIGVSSISLNFVPKDFPGACSLKFVNFFSAQWWSSSIAPDASGTYTVSPAYQAARINNGGPEHLLYVPAGSAIFAERNTVLVTEYSASNIVAYNLDTKGDPIPSTRAVFMSGYPGPEAMAIDPVTGDLLVTNLGGVTVNRIAGLRPPASQIVLTPAMVTLELGQPHTVTATVTEPLGAGRAGVSVAFAVTSGPNAGATGSCAPNPDCTADANGVVRFTYTGGSRPGTDFVQASFVGASCGTISSQLANVEWATTNRPPVAQSAAVTTDEDTPVAVALVASDPDGDALTYQVTLAPQHGVLGGTAPDPTYTPAANYNGSDTFTFKASDATADSNVAMVSITVNAVNDPPVASPATATTVEDGSTLITLPVSDLDGDALTYVIVMPPAHGTLSGIGASRAYTPESNYNGSDSFAFKTSDGTVDSNVATVSLTIAPVNDAPVANDHSVTASEDTPKAVTLVATDVDGNPLTYAIVTLPGHGTLTGSGDADRTYAPAANYNGPDSFTFTASDGQAMSNEATVTIDVPPTNDTPVAADQAVTTDEDTAVAVTLLAADVDGDVLSYVLGTPPVHGTLTGTAPALTYVPAANEHGPDSFTFSVNDGSAVSHLATVTISVTPVNDAPVAPSVALQVAQGQPSPVSIAATDVDGDALTYTIVSPPEHGALSGTAPDLIYTPAANYAGPDAVTFKASDGASESNLATASLDVVGHVNHAPVCSGALADQTSLWPPNHKMRSIAVTHVSDEDGDPVAIQATAIWSDEPADAPGSGNKSPDAVLEPIQVRSERSGEGNGRVYIIEFTASDGHGAACAGTARVCVPHDQGQGDQCIDDGVRYDATRK